MAAVGLLRALRNYEEGIAGKRPTSAKTMKYLIWGIIAAIQIPYLNHIGNAMIFGSALTMLAVLFYLDHIA
jgi:hypothetical protein